MKITNRPPPPKIPIQEGLSTNKALIREGKGRGKVNKRDLKQGKKKSFNAKGSANKARPSASKGTIFYQIQIGPGGRTAVKGKGGL